MIIAQLSDPHVAPFETEFDNLYHTADRLEKAIDAVNQMTPQPDIVVLTGDLVNAGSEEEYAILKPILDRLKSPSYLGVGNHDNRENFLKNFADLPYLPKDGFVQYAINMKGLRLIMLDTTIPGKPQGELCAERLNWLDKTLSEEPDMPTLIFMHHPPFKTGIAAMDNMGFLNADDFAAVLEKHGQVLRVFCGHLHRSIQSNVGGVQTQVCPSTSHKVLMHLGEEPRLATTAEPSEFLVHIWDGKDNVVSHSKFINDYPILWELEGGYSGPKD